MSKESPVAVVAAAEQPEPTGAYLHTFAVGSLIHLDGDPVGRDYTVISHGVSATTLRQELPTGFEIRSLSCWRRATAAGC